MSTLAVWLEGEHVADLDDTAGAGLASLRYTPEAIERLGVGAPALSVTLPVRDEPYSAFACRNWLDGLLPEDRVRAAVAERYRLGEQDIVGLLSRIGRECAGAVTILPPEEKVPVSGAVHWLTDEALDRSVRELPHAPFGAGIDGRVRASLGGVQGKLVLVVDETGRMGLPLESTPSTHLYKPTPLGDDGTERLPGLAHAETYAMRLVASVGIEAAEVEMRSVGRRRGVLVRRFDRSGTWPTLRRRHQEDLCQALALPPTSKYQGTMGSPPSLAHVAAVLDRHAAVPVVDKLRLFDMVVASAAVGNADQHAKNFALLLDADAGVRLAPAYDVVPTAVWPTVTTALALTIGGVSLLEDLTGENLDDEAESWGIGRRRATSRRREILAALDARLDPVLDELADEAGHDAVLDTIRDDTRSRMAALA